jgi:hypothetical protein
MDDFILVIHEYELLVVNLKETKSVGDRLLNVNVLNKGYFIAILYKDVVVVYLNVINYVSHL